MPTNLAPRSRPGSRPGRVTRRAQMSDNDFPAPESGFVVTHFLVVSDQDRSRDFYSSVFGAKVVLERDPVIMRIANSWLILNVGGGPTDDKPTVTLAPPADPDQASAFLNIRVADIAAAYAQWSARGAEVLTEPKDHGREIRAYIRDPDGHLIEVGLGSIRGDASADPGRVPARQRRRCRPLHPRRGAERHDPLPAGPRHTRGQGQQGARRRREARRDARSVL